MFCQKCGKEIKEGDMFCRVCGEKLITEVKENSQYGDATMFKGEENLKEAEAPLDCLTQKDKRGLEIEKFRMFADNYIKTNTKLDSVEALLNKKMLNGSVFAAYIIALFAGVFIGVIVYAVLEFEEFDRIGFPVALILYAIYVILISYGVGLALKKLYLKRPLHRFGGVSHTMIDVTELLSFLNSALEGISPNLHWNEWVLSGGNRVKSTFGRNSREKIPVWIQFGVIQSQNEVSTIKVLYFIGSSVNPKSLRYDLQIKAVPILGAAMEYYVKLKSGEINGC